jgi:hypothetical protein
MDNLYLVNGNTPPRSSWLDPTLTQYTGSPWVAHERAGAVCAPANTEAAT